MRKLPLFFAFMLNLYAYRGLEGQDVPNPPVPIQEGVQERLPSTPFPSSANLPSKAKIRLVRHGCYGNCPRYTVTVFGDGRALYEGADFVRLKGRTKATIAEEAVASLVRRVNDMHFFSFQPRMFQRCVSDGGTATITVSEPGRERQIDDECIDSTELGELEKAVDDAVEIQRWVFINATELQNQIELGWDITLHGQDHAQQAVEWDDAEVIRVLVKNGVPLETEDQYGRALLLQAVLQNRYKSAEVLLELGANPKTRDPDGWSPSQNAGNRSVEMCKLFLTHGSDINDQDGEGETMLMNAAGSPGNLEIVKFLVSSGAALNLRNSSGETAMGIAKRMRQQFQESIDSTWIPGFSTLIGDPEIARANYAATMHEYEAVIEYLRSHGGTE